MSGARASAMPRFVHRNSCASSSCTQRRCRAPHAVAAIFSRYAAVPSRQPSSTRSARLRSRRSVASRRSRAEHRLVVERRHHHPQRGRRRPASGTAGIGLQVERERRARAAREACSPLETRASATSRSTRSARPWPSGISGAATSDVYVGEAFALERSAHRRGAEVIDVDEVVGERRLIARPQPRRARLLDAVAPAHSEL